MILNTDFSQSLPGSSGLLPAAIGNQELVWGSERDCDGRGAVWECLFFTTKQLTILPQLVAEVTDRQRLNEKVERILYHGVASFDALFDLKFLKTTCKVAPPKSS